jgi:tetratricopeptide (TPR) repeat protein
MVIEKKQMENSVSQQQINDVAKDPISFFNSLDENLILDILQVPAQEKNKCDAILFSVSSLYLFIIENFTGPSVINQLNSQNLEVIKKNLPKDYEDDINLNGEYVHNQAKHKELIWIPFVLLQRYDGPKLWFARAAMVLQRCLTGITPTLKAICLPENEDEQSLDGIELCLAYHLFHVYNKYFEQLDVYRKSINFEFRLTGKLGKKTKFQQDSKSQFVVEVLDCESKRNSQEGDQKGKSVSELSSYSREVKLDELANLLERPKMDEEFEVPELSTNEIVFLLEESKAILERKLGDEIKEEKSLPILTTILESKPAYEIATVALFEKSKIEQIEHGTQHRAALQLQSIIDDFDKTETPALDRIANYFFVEHPPLWNVRKEMGIQMMKIGAARTAAEIFIQNKMWDELGICCEIANDPTIAIPILELEEPSPLVCTILGEQKKDKDMLEKAWKLSNNRASRPKRSLGMLYLKESNWNKAIENLEIAVRINPLYPEAQYALGCAFMRIENFEKAISAFQEVVSQKGDDAECFSNLAICFTTVGKHKEAHKAITQAIRFTRDNPKIWENFIVISLNAEGINDAIFGMEELNRYCPKWCNVPLIYEVETNIIEKKGDFKRFINVMEKISQTADCGFDFWTIYADIAKAAKDYESELEMRNNVIKALEGDEKITEADMFNRLAAAVEKFVEASKHLEGKARTARTRVRVTLKKYEDDFGSLDSYKRLALLAENL